MFRSLYNTWQMTKLVTSLDQPHKWQAVKQNIATGDIVLVINSDSP